MNRVLKILSVIAIIIGLRYCVNVTAGNRTDGKTTVLKTTVFEKCRHRETEEYPLPENATGLSGKKASKAINCEYQDFKNNRLYVKSVSEGYCERHFRTFLEGNSIKTEIIKTGETVLEYATAPSQFSQKDIEMLKKGIVTDSPEELSVLLQDYTS